MSCTIKHSITAKYNSVLINVGYGVDLALSSAAGSKSSGAERCAVMYPQH